MRHIKQFFKRHKGTIAIVVADLFLFFGVNPHNVPSIVLMLGLALAISTIYVLIGLLLSILETSFPSLHFKSRKIKVLLTLVVAFLVGLQSVGQLTTKDVIAIIPFVLVGYFYLIYPDNKVASDDHKR